MKVVPGLRGKYLLSMVVVKSDGLMLGEYASCVVACVFSSVVLPVPSDVLPHPATSRSTSATLERAGNSVLRPITACTTFPHGSEIRATFAGRAHRRYLSRSRDLL